MPHWPLSASIVLTLLSPPTLSAQSIGGGYPGTIYLVRLGTSLSVTPTVSGGVPPYRFAYDPNIGRPGTQGFPAGLQVDPATGTISGTPTGIGNYIVGIVVRDSSASGNSASFALYLSVISDDLQIGLASLPPGYPGQPYAVQLTANGGTPPYVWSVSSGSLPPGLSLQNNAFYGVLSGSPSQAGSWTFTLRATDSTGKTGSQQYTVLITGVQITSNTLPGGQVGAQYQQQLAAAGGQQPYRWSISAGSLAAGITLSETGSLSGNPTAAGSYAFSARASDSAGFTATASLVLTIVPATLTITTQLLPDATASKPFSVLVTATGGQAPLTFSILNGQVPAGLTLQPSGLLSGTPQNSGVFGFTFLARDFSGQQAQKALQLRVVPSELPTITSVTSAAGYEPFIASGAWVIIFGSNLAPDSGTGRGWQTGEFIDGVLPVLLDHVSVTINGKSSAIAWISPGQLNVQAPDDNAAGIVSVNVTTSKGSASGTAQLQGFAPGLFATANSSGTYWIAATHADGSAISPSSPAVPEEIIILYGSGFGPADPAQPSGKLITPAKLRYPVTATIGGQNASIQWSGLTAPGLDQFNVTVPSLAPGNHSIVLSIGGFNTQTGVLLPIATKTL